MRKFGCIPYGPRQAGAASASPEPVAGAVDGLDQRRLVGQLLAQRPDDGVHHVATAVVVIAPDFAFERDATRDFPLVIHEIAHDAELKLSQWHAMSVEYQLTGVHVQELRALDAQFMGNQTGEPA